MILVRLIEWCSNTSDLLLNYKNPVSTSYRLMKCRYCHWSHGREDVTEGFGVPGVPFRFCRSTVDVLVTQHNVHSLGLKWLGLRKSHPSFDSYGRTRCVSVVKATDSNRYYVYKNSSVRCCFLSESFVQNILYVFVLSAYLLRESCHHLRVIPKLNVERLLITSTHGKVQITRKLMGKNSSRTSSQNRTQR